jgi:hypothetical protein
MIQRISRIAMFRLRSDSTSSEGLTTCMEKGYQFTINSTTWNHIRMLWQAPPLDLLRLVYQETHVQNILETSGYRTLTWRILRALQSTPHQRWHMGSVCSSMSSSCLRGQVRFGGGVLLFILGSSLGGVGPGEGSSGGRKRGVV